MKEYFSLVIAFVTGIWILWNYYFKRLFAPKIKINISGEILGFDIRNNALLRTSLVIQNVGEVRLKINKIFLTVRGIKDSSVFKNGGPEILNQIDFDKKIYQENLIPKDWEYTFVDSGVIQEYNHSVLIPKQIQYLLIEAKMYYKNSIDFQIASKVLKVKYND